MHLIALEVKVEDNEMSVGGWTGLSLLVLVMQAVGGLASASKLWMSR